MTLIVRLIVAYAWTQFGISLTRQIRLIVLILIYYMHGNVTVSLTLTPILGSRPRSRLTRSGVRLQVTLIVRHVLAYAWTQFGISLTHQISLIVLILFYHIQRNVIVRVTDTPILASRPRSPSYMSGNKIGGDFNSQTNCSICLTSIWNIINTSN